MKNRLRRTPLYKQLHAGCNRMYKDCVTRKNDFVWVKRCVSRQHQVLLGVGIFFLLCWIIASIWLINLQRREPGHEEVLELQLTITMFIPAGNGDQSKNSLGELPLLTV